MADAEEITVEDEGAEDTRPRVTTTKPIDLAALDAELGGHGLCSGTIDDLATDAVEVEIVVADDSPVTAEQLAAAIEAHIPPPPPPTAQERIDAIVDAAPNWQSALKTLAAENLVGGE